MTTMTTTTPRVDDILSAMTRTDTGKTEMERHDHWVGGTSVLVGLARKLERELAERVETNRKCREADAQTIAAKDAKIAELEQFIANVTTERDKLHRRMEAMFPLFQEARDALTAIPLASAKLRGIDLTLGDRMDDVGIPERWNASEERKALEAPK